MKHARRTNKKTAVFCLLAVGAVAFAALLLTLKFARIGGPASPRPSATAAPTEGNAPPGKDGNPKERNRPLPRQIQDFLNGDYSGYHFTNKIDWTLPGVTNPSDQYNYYGMIWLRPMLQEWARSHDERLPERAIPLVLDFLRTFPEKKSGQPKMVWNDDSTARRCYNICLMIQLWKAYLTRPEYREIQTAMRRHARLLGMPGFYAWRQNHGLYQDRALLFYTKTFDDPQNAEYRVLVKSRVLDYARHLILPDGVNAEHSPYYHVNVADVLDTVRQDIEDVDPEFSAMLLGKYIDPMKEYAIYLTRPDGSYPPIGDSGAKFPRFSAWEDDPEYRYVETAGEEGRKPQTLDRVFPDGGYAIFRTGWELNGLPDWVMFLASTHNGSHKHQDDLSFLVWHHGELISDGGSKGYDYDNDPLALYAVQPWAHNVLVSNWNVFAYEKAYTYRPEVDERALKTRLLDYSANSGEVFAVGTQEKMPDVKQDRRLDWNKSSGLITVTDAVRSSREKNLYAFLFRMADDVQPVQEEGGRLALYRGEKREAEMQFESALPYTVKLCHGDEDGTVKAWDAATGKPIWTVAVQFEDAPQELKLVTRLQLLQ